MSYRSTLGNATGGSWCAVPTKGELESAVLRRTRVYGVVVITTWQMSKTRCCRARCSLGHGEFLKIVFWSPMAGIGVLSPVVIVQGKA